jgi:hypothetical protein
MEPMTAPTPTRLATLAALLAAAVLALAGCGDDEPEADDPNQPAPTSSSAPAEPSPSSAPPSASDSSSPEQVAVPVYFTGKTPIGTRLFREFRNVEADNPLEEAAALLTAGDALDPDYGTAFPPGQFASVTFDGSAVVVAVSDDSWNTPGQDMSKREARLAVQQLVYTVQGVQQGRVPVRVVDAGGDAVPLFGIDTAGGLKAAPQNDVLAFVNVTEPSEGKAVSGTFTASGVANSFEATVPWEVRDQSGAKVLEGFATAKGWGDRLYPWESPVDVSGLAPGTYTFVALTDDPSAGEGAGPTEDTKTIAVG